MIEEYQIWTLFNSGRIGSGLNIIWTILLLWLALRVAVATRNSEETNLFAKIVSSAFGLVILAFAWINTTTIANTWIAAARGLSDLKASGTSISSSSEGYIDYVGTTESVSMPVPLAIAFIVVSGIIILGQIWLPKK